MKKKFKTVMKIVCAYCGEDMGTKDGKGVSGTTSGICRKCADKEWKKLGGRPPARWNLIGRLLARFRRKRRALEIAQVAEDQADELERMNQVFAGNPGLHAYCLLRGDRFRHYILPEDLAEIEAAVADQPEIKCKWN